MRKWKWSGLAGWDGEGRGAAPCPEALVLVVVGQAHDLRARLDVREHEHLGVVLRDVLLARQLEPVQVRRHRHLRRRHRGRHHSLRNVGIANANEINGG